MLTIAQLKKGEQGIITELILERIPLKLIEMGCLPGNPVKLLQLAPYHGPMLLEINGSKIAIRRKTAMHIFIEKN